MPVHAPGHEGSKALTGRVDTKADSREHRKADDDKVVIDVCVQK